ncbi:MAG: hypothetical protein JWQ35_2563 [Bacteriovoracaceae bacterium]|nr:hypothetical protein [Bacteriovoracaceae bacterium]
MKNKFKINNIFKLAPQTQNSKLNPRSLPINKTTYHEMFVRESFAEKNNFLCLHLCLAAVFRGWAICFYGGYGEAEIFVFSEEISCFFMRFWRPFTSLFAE